MSFTSLIFIPFIIIMFLGYYLIPKKYQWIWLLIGSYLFYAYNSKFITICLIVSTLSTYIVALHIGKINENQKKYIKEYKTKLKAEEIKTYKRVNARKKQLSLIICLGINIGMLAFFKYSNFFISFISKIELINIKIEQIILPLGISFYTFQCIGYCVDVYREVSVPQKNLLRYALFVSYFPQICQGPIGRYNTLGSQLYEEHKFSYNRFVCGLERMLLGFFKKLVIANRIGIIVDLVYNNYLSYSGIVLAFVTVMYAFQIYADFSGYMDIVIGISECLGIQISENFDRPYLSKSIAEFWRRWHITLGVWFKDYLFYPLLRTKIILSISKRLLKNGHRGVIQMIPTIVVLCSVWILIGVWHGASGNFVFYGIYHGTFIIAGIVLETNYAKAKKILCISNSNKLFQLFQISRTFFIVCFGYIFFRADSLNTALNIVSAIITRPFDGSLHFYDSFFMKTTDIENWSIIIPSLLIMIIVSLLQGNRNIYTWLHSKVIIIRWGILYALILMILFFGTYGAGKSSFIYFEF